MVTINIAKDFSDAPGGRYRKHGPLSGQEFREDYLEEYFEDKENKEVITIILDGVEGYATSFLEEAFGGLAREYGSSRVLQRLRFVSEEDQFLVREIKKYIREANNKSKAAE